MKIVHTFKGVRNFDAAQSLEDQLRSIGTTKYGRAKNWGMVVEVYSKGLKKYMPRELVIEHDTKLGGITRQAAYARFERILANDDKLKPDYFGIAATSDIPVVLLNSDVDTKSALRSGGDYWRNRIPHANYSKSRSDHINSRKPANVRQQKRGDFTNFNLAEKAIYNSFAGKGRKYDLTDVHNPLDTGKYHSNKGFGQWLRNNFPVSFQQGTAHNLDIEKYATEWFDRHVSQFTQGPGPEYLNHLLEYCDGDWEKVRELATEKFIPLLLKQYNHKSN